VDVLWEHLRGVEKKAVKYLWKPDARLRRSTGGGLKLSWDQLSSLSRLLPPARLSSLERVSSTLPVTQSDKALSSLLP